MKILLVNRFFGDSQTPTGRMLLDVAEELAADQHQVSILTSQSHYVASKTNAGSSEMRSFELHFVPHCKGIPRLVSWLWFWLYAVVRVPLMKWDRCVFLTDPPFLPFASWTAKLIHGSSRRTLLWTMDLYPEALAASGRFKERGVLYKALKALMDAALRSTDAVIALGHCQLKRLIQYRALQGANRCCSLVVPPWDKRAHQPVRREANTVITRFGWQNRKVALYAGNLGEGHTYREFVDAARWLHDQKRTDWVFAFFVRGAKVLALRESARGLPNVLVMDYLSDSELSALLWAATVHLISMQPGWQGVIVPSKLYGVLKTNAPVIFVGPRDADTSLEISRLACGEQLEVGADGAKLTQALDRLAEGHVRRELPEDQQPGYKTVAAFIAAT